MIRYLAKVDDNGRICAVLRHSGPAGEIDPGWETVPEAIYQAYVAGNTVRIDGDTIDVRERVVGYAEQRSGAYPPLTDLADALYWQSRGNTAPMTEYLAKVEAVKQEFPKQQIVKHESETC